MALSSWNNFQINFMDQEFLQDPLRMFWSAAMPGPTGFMNWPWQVQQSTMQKVAQQMGDTHIALPFDKQYFSDQYRTEVFHQTPGEYGNDYALPVGTPIQAPAGGVIHVEDSGKTNWGKRIFVRMPNGAMWAVGHLTQFAANEGDTVQPGQVIGYSGGDVSDPSSGESTGPHIEIQLINPSGQYIDPLPVLNQMFSGQMTDYSSFTNLLGAAPASDVHYTQPRYAPFSAAQYSAYTPSVGVPTTMPVAPSAPPAPSAPAPAPPAPRTPLPAPRTPLRREPRTGGPGPRMV